MYEDQFMVIASAEDKDGVVAGLEVSFNGGQNFHPGKLDGETCLHLKLLHIFNSH